MRDLVYNQVWNKVEIKVDNDDVNIWTKTIPNPAYKIWAKTLPGIHYTTWYKIVGIWHTVEKNVWDVIGPNVWDECK